MNHVIMYNLIHNIPHIPGIEYLINEMLNKSLKLLSSLNMLIMW